MQSLSICPHTLYAVTRSRGRPPSLRAASAPAAPVCIVVILSAIRAAYPVTLYDSMSLRRCPVPGVSIVLRLTIPIAGAGASSMGLHPIPQRLRQSLRYSLELSHEDLLPKRAYLRNKRMFAASDSSHVLLAVKTGAASGFEVGPGGGFWFERPTGVS